MTPAATITNDGKGKPQSCEARWDCALLHQNGYAYSSISGYGATEEEARQNLKAVTNAITTKVNVDSE